MKKFLLTFAIFSGILCSSFALPALAQDNNLKQVQPLPNPLLGGRVSIEDGRADSLGWFNTTAAKLIAVMLNALAGLSLLPVVIGGIMMITSGGNSSQVDKGKESIKWGVIGVILAFSAVAVFQFILRVILPS